jgi:23S rRNA (pseudouridine1915-N3)-methyltransferase|tara:strand:+ start:624 stop:788 length:165 start_codon:yes stop_codon:yes gene_type:complete
LLDELVDSLSSNDFAKFLDKKYNANCKRIVFVIGGPYQFSESIYRLKNNFVIND